MGPSDFLVRVSFHGALRAARPDLPRAWVLREVVAGGPPGWEPRRLLTSLFDPSIGGDEIAALYPLRWEEETGVDEVKTHLGDAATVNRPLILRSRRPKRVEQEIYGYLVAYNAVRRLMVETAAPPADPGSGESVPPRGPQTVADDTAPSGKPLNPLRLSFTATLERLREAIRDMMRLPVHQLPERFAELQKAIRRVLVPPRPGRSYPRAVRIKMSNYPLKRRRRRAGQR